MNNKEVGANKITNDIPETPHENSDLTSIDGIKNKINTNILSEIEQKVLKSRINPYQKLIKKPSILSIDNVSFGSIGNFSCISGKPKSRKTFFLSMIMASALDNSGSFHRIKTDLQNKKVIHFDTEQSEYHTQLVSKRVLSMVKSNEKTKNYHCYCLRPYSPEERVQIIEYVIYKEKNIGLVIIDGIADLCLGYNDEKEAMKTVGKLLKWTGELNIHITTIIHQNKANNNSKGHLGGHLNQKAETVISVEKDNTVSKVTSDFSRDIDIAPLSFSIDEEGVPYFVDYVSNTSKQKKTDPNLIDISEHKKILKNIFDEQPKLLNRKEIIERIKWSLGIFNYPNGDDKSKEFLTYYKENNFVNQEGKNKPYSLNDKMVG